MEMNGILDQMASYVIAKKDGEGSTAMVGLVQSSDLAVLTRLVCKNDDACAAFQTRFPGDDGTGNQGNETNDMVCYKGGLAIERNWQMCDVTSELPPPCHLSSAEQQIERLLTRYRTTDHLK